MSFVDTSVACFEISSVVLGYRALHVVTQASGVRVLEASVAGQGRFVIIAQGPAETLRALQGKVREATDGASLIDTEVVEKVEPTVLEALYSLTQVSLESALAIIECETVSGLLASAQILVHGHRLKPIEIKIHRARAGGYAFFTGANENCGAAVMDVEARLQAKMRKGEIEVIVGPSAAFREFFNFSGQS
jgi:microcompartment protein CcmL/EutN